MRPGALRLPICLIFFLLLIPSITSASVLSAIYRTGSFEESFLPKYVAFREDAAFFTVKFDQPVYFKPIGGCLTNQRCNASNFGVCCMSCDPVRFVPVPSPSNAHGCVCASRPNSVCLEASQPYIVQCAFLGD